MSRIVDGELTKYKQNDEFFTLFSNEFNKAIEEIRLRERETLLNLMGQRSHVFGQLADSIHKRQQETFGQLADSIHERQQDTFGQLSGKAFDPIIGNIGISNLKPIRKILEPIPSYYPVSELSTVETAGQIPADSKALDYVKRLRKCKRGRENWKEYQDLCTEILTYCLVPPLMEPSEQSQNIGARHKRDIIFQIPHGAGKFWDWIVLKFGLGIVVECKNYTDALKENEVVITSKYLGKKKLTTLGAILTRAGLTENAQHSQIDKWKLEDILMICLNDKDLAKMLELREKDQDPGKVIDNAVRKLLEKI